MFDIGFWELALIAVIALIVLGPERLPGAARTLGLWVGRARRYTEKLRVELENAAGTEEIRRDFESVREDIESVRDEVSRGGRQLRAEVEGDDDAARGASSGSKLPADSEQHRPADTGGDPAMQSDGRNLQAQVGGDSNTVESLLEERPEPDGGETRPVASDVEHRE